VPQLRLRAPAGGTALFSGIIQDAGATTYSVPIVVHGGSRDAAAGTIELSGTNTYLGTTVVRSGTLLLDNAQAMGSGTNAVLLGDQVVPMASARTVKYGSFHPSTGGLFTNDNVALAEGDRVLMALVENSKWSGLWVAHAGHRC
jgi:autotransporter-associated beta strand protein